MVRRGSVGSASVCWKAGPSSIDSRPDTTGRSVPLSLQAMRRWREASANVLYECVACQKNFTVLHSAVPEIKIMDERNSKVKEQIIYEWGSTIELRCVVSNLVGDQPEYIIWKKDDRMLNYDLERGGIRYWTIK